MTSPTPPLKCECKVPRRSSYDLNLCIDCGLPIHPTAEPKCCAKCLRTYPVSAVYKDDPSKGHSCTNHSCPCHTAEPKCACKGEMKGNVIHTENECYDNLTAEPKPVVEGECRTCYRERHSNGELYPFHHPEEIPFMCERHKKELPSVVEGEWADRFDDIVDGIDRCETDKPEEGWWETSTGAKFGIKIKQRLKSLITTLLHSEREKGRAEECERIVKMCEGMKKEELRAKDCGSVLENARHLGKMCDTEGYNQALSDLRDKLTTKI